METTLTIGSDEVCDICIGGRFIDKQHATITISGEQVTIMDLGSQFGTFVNGQRITEERLLLPKDKVKIGTQLLDWQSYAFDFENAESDPNPIHFGDLFTYKGEISKSNYRFILLFSAISPLLIFFGVPAILILLQGRSGPGGVDYLVESLWALFSLLAVYIFVMQSIKRYRTYQNEKE
ncbi:MAG: hypothetical protein Roseis2KO_30940 [Roseivirga sp.]